MNDLVIDEVRFQKGMKWGNSSHLCLPKKHLGKECIILVVKDNDMLARPKIHWDTKKVENGESYVKSEITTNVGSHTVWLKEADAGKLFTR